MSPDEEAMQEQAIQEAAENCASALGGTVTVWRRAIEAVVRAYEYDVARWTTAPKEG